MSDIDIDIDNIDDLFDDFEDAEIATEKEYAKDKYYDDVEGFLQLPNVKKLHLYFMIDYDFVKHISIPFEDESENDMFDKLTDNGAIGKTLQTSKSIIFPERYEKKSEEFFTVIPISEKEKITGIIIVELDKHWKEESEQYLKICDTLAKAFHYRIYSEELETELSKVRNNIEQKVSEKIIEISKGKDELNVILKAIQAGVLISEVNSGKIIRSNPIAIEMTGFNALELSNMKIYNFFKDSNSIRDSHYETKLKSKSGEMLHVLTKNSTYMLSDYEYRVDSFIDISDLKFAQELLENTNQILEKKVEKRTKELEENYTKLKKEIEGRKQAETAADKEKEMREIKSKFLQTVSHEFRSPLTIIRSSAEILNLHISKLSEEDIVKFSKRIVDTSDYLTNVLQNILFVQYEETQLVGGGINQANVHDLINAKVGEIERAHGDFNMVLENKVDEHYELTTNRIILERIVKNIIDNSHAYRKLENSKLVVELEDKDDKVRLSFWDNGMGIPKADLTNVAELFFRSSNVGNIPGVGLGLAVAKHNLELLGGDIEIDSKEGEFTKVTLILPKK